MLVSSADELTRLLRLLRSDTRRVPLIIVSKRRDKTGPVITAGRLQVLLGETGIVKTLSGVMFGMFNRYAGRFPLCDKGVRLYEPGMDPLDYHARHPFWNQQAIDQLGADRFIQLIVEHCAHEAKYRQNGQPPVDTCYKRSDVLTIRHKDRPILTVRRKSENLELPHSIEATSD